MFNTVDQAHSVKRIWFPGLETSVGAVSGLPRGAASWFLNVTLSRNLTYRVENWGEVQRLAYYIAHQDEAWAAEKQGKGYKSPAGPTTGCLYCEGERWSFFPTCSSCDKKLPGLVISAEALLAASEEG